MGDYALLQRPQPMGGVDPDPMDISLYCPFLSGFQVRDVTQSELLALSHAGAGRQGEVPMWYGVSLDSAR